LNGFRATLAYDGTDFEGWQAQAGARAARTVQGVVEGALARLFSGARVRVDAAGRTDAGVHALGQVISFTIAPDMEPQSLARALNAILPPDVRVLEARRAPPGFHARKSALSKQYRYELDAGPVQMPARRRFAGHVPGALERAALVEAAALFVGRRDFAALASTGSSVKTTVRTVSRSEVRLSGETLVYEVEADGFLRKMVRSMVGGLVAAGRGAVPPAHLGALLAARDRRAWPAPAEARGLTLVRVDYPPDSSA
jgi:tRNA pseudouridine38-40 synthase